MSGVPNAIALRHGVLRVQKLRNAAVVVTERLIRLGAVGCVILAIAGALFAYDGSSRTGRVTGSMTDEAQLKHKFRGIQGGELFVDAITEVRGVNILNDNGDYFYASGSLSLRNQSRHAYSSHFGMPRNIRVIWRDDYTPRQRDPSIPSWMYTGGTVLGDYTVPVASRIPEDLLDAVRARKGQLRLKIRIHPDGPLIGWDLLTAVSTDMAGGDFREAKLDNGIVVRKGWYIHPRTKEKIETDF
jgi:hypothetical protein